MMHKTVSPDNSDGSIEGLIVAKGKTAPRITPTDVEAAIAGEYYFTADSALGPGVPRILPALALLTFCVLVLKNGFTVTGESACASPENFDEEIGRRVARSNAVQKIWPLLGYVLKNELARPVLTDADAAADLAGTPRPDNPNVAATAG